MNRTELLNKVEEASRDMRACGERYAGLMHLYNSSLTLRDRDNIILYREQLHVTLDQMLDAMSSSQHYLGQLYHLRE